MEEGPKLPDNFQEKFERERDKKEKALEQFRSEIRELSLKHIDFFDERFDKNDLNEDDMRIYHMFEEGGRVFTLSDALERLNKIKASSDATLGSKMLAEYMYETMRERMLSKL